ncbi:MAG TPA: NAD(P)H-dependent glycerol-3-phosphate dehydrogenase [Deinococcales bacterium]|nr:NAD(P)H-dependent glycerol-3-phosphate dehydrogenase [Deinococcales bacterium]
MLGVSVVGAGGWGTALAVLLARQGAGSVLWCRRDAQAAAIGATRVNATYLPGVVLPESIEVTARLEDALAEVVFLAVPAAALAAVTARLPEGPLLVSCAKGLDPSGNRLSTVLRAQGHRVAVLSGPNHAEEIGLGLPAASVVAAGANSDARAVQELLTGPNFRVYTSSDLPGVELGGVLKNVMALAAGMADGLSLGDNAKAALVTRGLAEMLRFAAAQGARPETLYGLSGLGDLLATCFSAHSRNRAAGERIARGLPAAQGPEVVEGLGTAPLLGAWAEAAGLEMPLVRAVNRVLTAGASPRAELEALMARPPRSET